MKKLILITMIILSTHHTAFANEEIGPAVSRSLEALAAEGRQRHMSVDKPKNKISGHTLIAGDGNLTAIPCINVMLKLEGNTKDEVYFTRTSSAGKFAFYVSHDGKYKIGVNSKLYEVVSPVDELTDTKNINLQLRQRQLKQEIIK
jgi:hypothetical protein